MVEWTRGSLSHFVAYKYWGRIVVTSYQMYFFCKVDKPKSGTSMRFSILGRFNSSIYFQNNSIYLHKCKDSTNKIFIKV